MCYFRPIRKSVRADDIKENYILVQPQFTTAALWQIVGDNNGWTEKTVDVILENFNVNIGYDILFGKNTFICYGEFSDDIVTAAGYENKVFKVNKWDILYPVHHEHSIFSAILSENYLYRFEISE